MAARVAALHLLCPLPLPQSQLPVQSFCRRAWNSNILPRSAAKDIQVRRSAESDSGGVATSIEIEKIDDNTTDAEVPDLLKEYIESIWIFKVFGSFGLMLPAILLSMLFATGPKAFLMALAVPIGHSTFSFAITKFQQRSSNIPLVNDNDSDDDEEEEEKQPQIPNKQPDTKAASSSSSSSLRGWDDDKATTNSVRFGGWDEVIHFRKVSSSVKRAAATRRRFSRMRRTEEEEEEMLRQKNVFWDENVGSLLMRLLVFVLPLVSKWIEMMLFSKDSYT